MAIEGLKKFIDEQTYTTSYLETNKEFWLYFHRETKYKWFDKEQYIPATLFGKIKEKYMAINKLGPSHKMAYDNMQGYIPNGGQIVPQYSIPNNPNEVQRLIQEAQEDKSKAIAVKNDKGKPRFDLFPPEAMFATAEVFEIGSHKYDDRNWELGMSWGRVFGAMMRHAWKFWMGERYDKEDGQEHLASVIWCAMVLLTYEHRKLGTDDRKV